MTTLPPPGPPVTTYNPHARAVLEFDRLLGIVAGMADSAEGQRRIRALEPSPDPEYARARLGEADELMQAILYDNPLPRFSAPPIESLFAPLKVPGAVLDIEDLAAIAAHLEIVGDSAAYFAARPRKYPVACEIAAGLVPLGDLLKSIRTVITPDLTIADDASPELRRLRREIGRMRSSLREMMERELASLSDDVVGERVVTIREGRLVIPVRDNMKRSVPGAVHDRSQTGRTLFIEPLAAIEGNNHIRECEMAEQAEVYRILADLSARAARSVEELSGNHERLVRLDTIAARARYGVSAQGTIPTIEDVPVIRIVKGRHPLLDWKLRSAGAPPPVPLTLDLGGDRLTIVITGPNAGGKTVALKTLGLLVLMAMSGIPVPAAPGTTLFAPPDLFVDIGDEQSIQDDLSTFSSHMKHIVTILREAAPRTLVLMDELGGGTNPADGEAIALAVLKKLTGLGSLTVATSHHDGLKLFAHETPGVINASMEFDTEEHRPTFVLKIGVPGSSYAFSIARRMGMPTDVLQDAETLAGGERKSLASLITEMEELVRQAAEDRATAAAERERLTTELDRLERTRTDLTSRKSEILAGALDESRRIVAEANRQVEDTIRSIREKNASHDAIVEAKQSIATAAETIRERREQLPQKPAPKAGKPVGEMRVGMAVQVEGLSGIAVIEDILAGGEKARIRLGDGSPSLVVARSRLTIAEKKAEKRQRVVVSTPSTDIESSELDVRGMTFDEARDAIESFLGDMSAGGMDTAHIIHGKGTGALRRKIGDYLTRHPAVESFRLGNWNEGSFGVTVVTLRR